MSTSCTGACNRPLSTLAWRDAVMAAHEGEVGPISATAIWRGLVTIVACVKPRLVIIDTLADVFAGNENARQFGGG
jgi:RecA-family ATPase